MAQCYLVKDESDRKHAILAIGDVDPDGTRSYCVLALSTGTPMALLKVGLAVGSVASVVDINAWIARLNSRGMAVEGPVATVNTPSTSVDADRKQLFEAFGIEADTSEASGPQMVPAILPELTDEQMAGLMQLEDRLGALVHGQDEAIARVSDKIRSSLLGLKEKDKPDGVIILAGPSGVGKSELAKALSTVLSEIFGATYPLLPFDMTEFMEKHSASGITGPPPGYVGYEEGGKVAGAIRRSPRAIALLDELDKMHSDAANALLPAFAEARLQDNHGRTVDCAGVLFLGTANYASSSIKIGAQRMGFGLPDDTIGVADMSSAVEEGYRQQMRPEFRGRVDDVVVLNPLSDETIHDIAEAKLADKSAWARARGLSLEFTPEAVDEIATHERDPLEGARHVAKAVSKLVDPLVSRRLIQMRLQRVAVDSMVVGRAGPGKLDVVETPSEPAKPAKKQRAPRRTPAVHAREVATL